MRPAESSLGVDALSARLQECESKERRLRVLLKERRLDVAVLRRASSFAWATAGGASWVNTASDRGEAFLVIGPEGRAFVTSNIEAERLAEEEGLRALGFRPVVYPWHASAPALSRGVRVGSDLPGPGEADLSRAIAEMREDLVRAELTRFRFLGADAAEALVEAARRVEPGLPEHRIAADLGGALLARGIQPIVLQVASDERVLAYRHVLPTDKPIARYALLSFCGRRRGLVCSMTRLVHVGPVPEELRVKHEACARVDAALIAATRPSTSLRALFAVAQAAYASAGYDGEWRKHHQGGTAGYEPRETVATPDAEGTVAVGQVFAWNPSIAGTKSEDTIAVGAAGPELLTATPGWPSLEVGGLARPAILEI